MASFPAGRRYWSSRCRGLGKREGGFFPGLAGRADNYPCHGYESSRGELLTLESALKTTNTRFHFDFAAHGANAGIRQLGYREAARSARGGRSPGRAD